MPADRQRPALISVILSTYNAPLWLEKSLWGYAFQCHRDFEIVIADDGSETETAELIDRMREQTGLTLRHVWHEDDGFRKCTILNRAIEAAAGDYLLFSDGDCIPRSDFVWHHHQAAEVGRFLSGGYYKLPLPLSRLISVDDIRSGRAFSVSWLRANGLKFSHRLLRLTARGRLAEVLNRLTTTRPSWNGNNASGWAADIGRANGFDERMRYGGEDRELGERLENAGIRGKHVRFQSVCLHLDHARGYVNAGDLERNLQIRQETKRIGRVRTDHGIRRAA
jgi:glycosyltransferase involved in cell wall biosynthesis